MKTALNIEVLLELLVFLSKYTYDDNFPPTDHSNVAAKLRERLIKEIVAGAQQ
jgi:hypothetical protein